MPTVYKSHPITITNAVPAVGDGNKPLGLVSALVSVFDVVDYQGDVVERGAFTKSLATWRASGDPIPVLVDHNWGVEGHVGWVDPKDVTEVKEGLLAKNMHFDLDTPLGARTFDLIKQRRLKEYSFAYDVVRESRRPSDSANVLSELSLIEISATMKGANPYTQTLSVKARTPNDLRRSEGLDVPRGSDGKLLNPRLFCYACSRYHTVKFRRPKLGDRVMIAEGPCGRLFAYASPSVGKTTVLKALAKAGSWEAAIHLDPGGLERHLVEAAKTLGVIRGDDVARLRTRIRDAIRDEDSKEDLVASVASFVKGYAVVDQPAKSDADLLKKLDQLDVGLKRRPSTVTEPALTPEDAELRAFRSAAERAMPTAYSVAGISNADTADEADQRRWRPAGSGEFYTEVEGSPSPNQGERVLRDDVEVRITDKSNEIAPEPFSIDYRPQPISTYTVDETKETPPTPTSTDGVSFTLPAGGEVEAPADPNAPVQLPVAAKPAKRSWFRVRKERS